MTEEPVAPAVEAGDLRFILETLEISSGVNTSSECLDSIW